MTDFEKRIKEVIKEWATIDDMELFLDFAQGVDISAFTVENGERVIYIANGLYNIADGYRIGEHDGKAEKYIINTLSECGIDFKEGRR
jgi:hypothetical protein